MAVTLPGRKDRYTIHELARIVVWTGFRGTGAPLAVAIIMAESAGRTRARHIVGSEGGRAAGSVDRGLMQINSYWHPEVSDSCAYDPYCNVSAGYRISGHGQDFSAWSTFKNGAFRTFIHDAVQAVRDVGGVVTGAPQGPLIPTGAGGPSTLDQALDFVLGPLNWGPIGWLKSHIKAVVLAAGRYVFDKLHAIIHPVGVAAGHALHLIDILWRGVRKGFHDVRVWAHRGFVDLRKWVSLGLRQLERLTRRLLADLATWVRREVWAPLKRLIDGAVRWVRTTVIPFLERLIRDLEQWARRAVRWLHDLIRDLEQWARRAVDKLLDLLRPVLDFMRRFAALVATFFTKAIGWVEWMVRWPPTKIVDLVLEAFRRSPRTLTDALIRAMADRAAELEDWAIRIFFGR